MKYTLGILLFLISFISQAQKAQDQIFEKKFHFLQYDFYQGNFDDVISEGQNFINKKKLIHNGNRSYFQILVLMARAQYLNSEFDQASKTISLINKESEVLNDTVKVNGYEALAEVNLYTNQPLEALKILTKSEGLKCSQQQKNDLSLLKAWALYNQGYYNESLKLLDAQEALRQNAIASSQSESTDFYFKKPANDLKAKKEKYFIHQNLKALVLTAQQNLDNAGKLINQLKDWSRKNNELVFPAFAQASYTEGLWNEAKKNDVNAANAYASAFSKSGFQENVPGKTKALFKSTLTNIRLGNFIQSETLIRELHMFALSYSGWNEPFTPWYELAMCYKLYYEGETEEALLRLEKFKKSSSVIPESHDIINEYYNIIHKIEYETGDILAYLNHLDQHKQVVSKIFGEASPTTKRIRLQKAITYLKFYGLSDSIQTIITNDVNKVCSQLNTKEVEACKYFDLTSDYYFQTGKIDSALKYADKARFISSKDTINKADELSLYYHLKYAQCLLVSGKTKEAYQIIKEKENLILKLPINDNPENIKPLLLLNELYLMSGDLEKSEHLRSTLAGFSGELKFLYNPIVNIETDYAFAGIYKETNNFLRAEKHLNRALSETKRKFSSTAFSLPILLRSAQLSLAKGNYEQADKLIAEGLKIAEKGFGKTTIAYANVLKVQAEYFEAIADYNKAQLAAGNARAIYEKTLGPNNGYNIGLILFQAEVSLRSAKYKVNDVSKLYETALTNAATLYTENSDAYMNIALKKAEFLITITKYKDALVLLDKAQKFWNTHSDLNSIKLAKLLSLKGKMFYNQKDYIKAEKQYEEAAKLYKDIFSNTHPLYNSCKGDLARVYYMEKEYNKSLSALEEIIPHCLHYVEKLFPTMSFRQKTHFWNNLKNEFEFYNFLVLKHFANQKSNMIGNVYNNVISTKAILLSSDIKIRDLIANSGDSLLISMYEDWVSQKELLTSAYTMSKSQLADQNINLSLIEENIEQLEKSMGERSELFVHEKKENNISWHDIQKTLNENESVIEMVRVRYFNHTFADSAFYAALILNKNTSDNPDLVLLSGAAFLETKSYSRYRNSIIFKLNDKHSFKNYWEPLQAHLTSKQHIYFSPDGIYNQVNPETFRIDDNKFLSDEYSFTFLTNSKDMLNEYAPTVIKKKKKEKIETKAEEFVFVGNPDFYISSNEDGTITQLPGAELEVKELSELLLANGRKNQLIVGKNLTEDTIKSVNNVILLHIATHGFFNESKGEEDENFILSDQMLNSGVLFAGAGEIIDNHQNLNSVPGILTAYEAAGMRLNNTELVILSACETGRGEVKNGEGVFGLQRAFLLAGSNAVIMSLFKVDDEVTRKFMKYFYENWLNTGDKRDALKYAKQKIKEQYPEPIYWGAFVMVESKPKASKAVLVK